jgi:hypothetical protein
MKERHRQRSRAGQDVRWLWVRVGGGGGRWTCWRHAGRALKIGSPFSLSPLPPLPFSTPTHARPAGATRTESIKRLQSRAKRAGPSGQQINPLYPPNPPTPPAEHAGKILPPKPVRSRPPTSSRQVGRPGARCHSTHRPGPGLARSRHPGTAQHQASSGCIRLRRRRRRRCCTPSER